LPHGFHARSALAIPLALFGLAGVAISGCGGDDDSPTPEFPPTPMAYLTPPVPRETVGIGEFLPECDLAVIRAARKEAALREALFACKAPMQWAGAVTRYPAALQDPSSGDVFGELHQMCFEASNQDYARSSLCQAVVAGRTIAP